MKNNDAPDVFSPFIKALCADLVKCSKSSSPSKWLYTHGAREIVFRLEALYRLQSKISGSKKDLKTLRFFKKLEDQLGKIDEYAVLSKIFTSNKEVPEYVSLYYKEKTSKSMLELNEDLIKNDFYLDHLKEFAASKKFEFNSENGAKVRSIMKKTLAKCETLMLENNVGFTDFEEQVHELRRKIRWVSIYAASLGGFVTLKFSSKKFDWEKDYEIARMKKSPYTKLPKARKTSSLIKLEGKAFCALSYVIEKLGDIKDLGLTQHAVEKVMLKHRAKNLEFQLRDVLIPNMLPTSTGQELLLKEAHRLLSNYFTENKIHRNLVL